MLECVNCGRETELHIGSVPICLACANAEQVERRPPERELAVKRQRILRGTPRTGGGPKAMKKRAGGC